MIKALLTDLMRNIVFSMKIHNVLHISIIQKVGEHRSECTEIAWSQLTDTGKFNKD